MSTLSARFDGKVGSFRLNMEFTIPSRGVTALFGPSGCGKTTLLRCIAGLNHMPGAELTLDGEVWQKGRTFVPTHKRPIGYVFQEPGLFPHLSVRKNLTYGMKRAGIDSRDSEHLNELTALMGIEHLLERGVTALSGGEKQRVAIARALLMRPRLLLMDEPLSALDQDNKNEIMPYLEQLHSQLEIPVIYVTHDRREVERLADQLLLLRKGELIAQGEIGEILTNPDLPFGRSQDAVTVLDGRVRHYDARYGLSTLQIDGGTLEVPDTLGPTGVYKRLRIASTDVSLALNTDQPSTILNRLPAVIWKILPTDGPSLNVLLRIGNMGEGSALLASVTRKSVESMELKPGQSVFAQIKGASLLGSSTTNKPRKHQMTPLIACE
ncbi:molybdenum ABC transporter ATP-binding protein [Marinobacterium lutimaris]|uniref:Molybdate transport system ATP-binding protein n=1 Tax=Marinobacterium lutimaris TaxID=568106 RepID=A0A1H5TGG0_9GAMM|nr:molybdenum ABC transporter ATP-binding protein [Marinobacterium lutimaris]SEF61854.1 molybdate transport system ATP-binding protein [Marinobacterium lutimaris]